MNRARSSRPVPPGAENGNPGERTKRVARAARWPDPSRNSTAPARASSPRPNECAAATATTPASGVSRKNAVPPVRVSFPTW